MTMIHCTTVFPCNTEAPTFDIIIPSYNAARYLPATIESVITQTYKSWRILLVDDGSTDETGEILEPYRKSLGEKLVYLRQPNGGMCQARNAAIRNSSAKFLAFLDADDTWLPCRLRESLNAFRRRPEIGLDYGYNSRVDADGEVIDVFTDKGKHGEGWIVSHLYMRSLDVPCLTVTVRRECIDEVGNFDEGLQATEDRDLWLRIATRYQVALIPKVIAQYRISPSALTSDPDRMLQGQLQFIAKHFGRPGCGPRERRVALSRAYRQRAEALAQRGQMRSALLSAARALAWQPTSPQNARTTTSLSLRYTGLLR